MAKLQEAIEALAKVDGTKPLAEALKTELGELAGMEAKDLAALPAKAAAAEKQIGELTASVKDLGAKAEGADALKAKVDAFEGEKRASIIEKAFAEKAKEAGINAGAIATAQRLVKLDALQVDLDKGTVSGLTKEVFDGLKASDPILFAAPAAAAPAPAATVPAIPPAGTGAPAAQSGYQVKFPVIP